MTVIYVDTLFLLNTMVDYLLLLASARLAGEPLARLRFALGAVLGSRLIARMGQWAILCSSALLAVCFLLMFIQTEEEKRDAL